MTEVVRADALQIGDRFKWAGHEVELVDWKPDTRGPDAARPGRYLICALGAGEDRQLHYYDHEMVNRTATAYAGNGP